MKNTKQKLDWFLIKFKPVAWFCVGGIFGIAITYLDKILGL